MFLTFAEMGFQETEYSGLAPTSILRWTSTRLKDVFWYMGNSIAVVLDFVELYTNISNIIQKIISELNDIIPIERFFVALSNITSETWEVVISPIWMIHGYIFYLLTMKQLAHVFSAFFTFVIATCFIIIAKPLYSKQFGN
jgi:hypothetical protein